VAPSKAINFCFYLFYYPLSLLFYKFIRVFRDKIGIDLARQHGILMLLVNGYLEFGQIDKLIYSFGFSTLLYTSLPTFVRGLGD
jgi:hypothetical protein